MERIAGASEAMMTDAPIYQMSSNTFFIDLLEHDKFLERYEHNLRGEVEEMQLVQDTNQYAMVWKKRYPSKMNDEGITSTISFLRTICEKIISITNFDDDLMGKMIYQNIQDLTDRLVENWFNYEFRSIADLDEINMVGRNMIIAQLSRSKDGMTLKAVTSNTVISENKTIAPPTQDQQMMQRPGAGGILSKIGLKI